MPRQHTFTVVPRAPGHALNTNEASSAAFTGRVMTSKQVRLAHKAATKTPTMSRAERLKHEREEQERIRKEFEKEKAAAKARAARERKKEKELAELEQKKKAGLPLTKVRPSQDTIARFVRGNGFGKKRDASGSVVVNPPVEENPSPNPEITKPLKQEEEELEEELEKELEKGLPTDPFEASNTDGIDAPRLGSIPEAAETDDITDNQIGEDAGNQQQQQQQQQQLRDQDDFTLSLDDSFLEAVFNTANLDCGNKPTNCETVEDEIVEYKTDGQELVVPQNKLTNKETSEKKASNTEASNTKTSEMKTIKQKPDGQEQDRSDTNAIPKATAIEVSSNDDLELDLLLEDDDLELEMFDQLERLANTKTMSVKVASGNNTVQGRYEPISAGKYVTTVNNPAVKPRIIKPAVQSAVRPPAVRPTIKPTIKPAARPAIKPVIKAVTKPASNIQPRLQERQKPTTPNTFSRASNAPFTRPALPSKTLLNASSKTPKRTPPILRSSPSPPFYPPPMSTQAILLNLDDIFPSPSQQIRELEEDCLPIAPPSLQSQPVKSTPPQPSPRRREPKRFFTPSGSSEQLSLALHLSRRAAALEELHQRERMKLESNILIQQSKREAANITKSLKRTPSYTSAPIHTANVICNKENIAPSNISKQLGTMGSMGSQESEYGGRWLDEISLDFAF